MAEQDVWRLIAAAEALPPGDPQRAEHLTAAEEEIAQLEQLEAEQQQ